jgi:hypothetical protein
MHGWNVRTFHSFEEALYWLSSGEQTGPRRKLAPGEKRIAVRFPERGAERPARAPARTPGRGHRPAGQRRSGGRAGARPSTRSL